MSSGVFVISDPSVTVLKKWFPFSLAHRMQIVTMPSRHTLRSSCFPIVLRRETPKSSVSSWSMIYTIFSGSLTSALIRFTRPYIASAISSYISNEAFPFLFLWFSIKRWVMIYPASSITNVFSGFLLIVAIILLISSLHPVFLKRLRKGSSFFSVFSSTISSSSKNFRLRLFPLPDFP